MASLEINETGWKPQAIKMKCDTPLAENMVEPLCYACKSNFLLAVIGRSGSGKTNYTHGLFRKQTIRGKKADFCQCFHTIIYCSPSSGTVQDNVFGDLPATHRLTDFEECLDSYMDIIELDVLQGKKMHHQAWQQDCERARAIGKKAPKKPKDYQHRTLIYFDDCGFQQRTEGGYEQKMNDLVHNRRHKFGGISIISCNQDYTQLAPQIRKSCNGMVVFQPGIDEYNVVFSKMGIPRKIHDDFMDKVYDAQYNFVFCDFTRGVPKLYKNQDSLITLKRK